MEADRNNANVLRFIFSASPVFGGTTFYEYDLGTGIVEFSENAVITEGGNQISSSFLIYNIPEQRINAQSSGDGDEKVKITYTPVDEDTARITQGISEEIAEGIPEELVEEISEKSGERTQ